MASFLFNYSSSSSEHDEYDYEFTTPIRKNPVYRKLFNEEDMIDVDTYVNVGDRGKNEDDNIEVNDEDDCGNNDYDHHDFNMRNEDDFNMGNEDGGENHDFDTRNECDENINDVVPNVGMYFDTLEEAGEFYRKYGRKIGFEIIIRNTHKNSKTNEPTGRLFICRKGGRLGSKSLDSLDNEDHDDRVKEKRARDVIPRTQCHARMNVVYKVDINKWVITAVDLDHNHPMVKPDKVQFFRRPDKIDPLTRSLIELFHRSGIETAKTMTYLSELCGGIGNLGFSGQDIRNVIRDIRRRVFDSGDAECGLKLLRQLQQETNFGKFFYRVDVDEENRVRGLVWVDPRSLNAYKNFGDVVTFDSTYRTNRYDMPFIPLTGINHHYQNILFGFALIRDEKEPSYIWVLKTWLEAVGNKPPLTIITDQDMALTNAIAKVMPHTKHLFCTWHISSKFPEKLSKLYTTYSDFKSDFNACVHKSLTPTEFEGKWEELVEKYCLAGHVWLQDMYAIRSQWIGAYTRQHFSAGMTTTSRSESMNSFFDEYVHQSTGLKEFIENSQKALETQYLKEVKSDYETEEKQRTLVLFSSLEMHGAEVYTKEMFKRFQKELLKSSSYVVNKVKGYESYMYRLYLVRKSTVAEDRARSYRLMVRLDENIECECKKWEHSGMICRHIIRYLDKKNKIRIPPDYITDRWTMKGNRIAGPLPYTPPILVNVGASQHSRYNALCQSFQSLGAIGSCSEPRFKYLMNVIEKEKINVKKAFPEEERQERKNESFYDDEYYQGDPIFDPPMSQTKGRKKAGRFKSGIETSTSTPKPRKCGKCGEVGAKHDRRNCPRNL